MSIFHEANETDENIPKEKKKNKALLMQFFFGKLSTNFLIGTVIA